MHARPTLRGASSAGISCFLYIILLPFLLKNGVHGLRYNGYNEGGDLQFPKAKPVVTYPFVETREQQPLAPPQLSTPPSPSKDATGDSPRRDTLPALMSALSVLQSHFFELWQGTWPHAIDWTAAVMGTHLSSTLSLLTRSPAYDPSLPPLNENLINQYFSHLTSFYFGENAFSLRTQAYDDILWVVLDWISAINFVNLHDELHFGSQGVVVDSARARSEEEEEEGRRAKGNITYYGKGWIPVFAHRARIFYELASKGWDTSLCGGGMVWSPYLTPYKNAITNQLWIAASVNMYLYFPGDDNSSPFAQRDPGSDAAFDKDSQGSPLPPSLPNDPKFLRNAIEAYKWLSSSNMTNAQGLFTDGFHIRGGRSDKGGNGSIGSGRCDVRDEQVYTYNQGVLLSGLRGLWLATGARSYLEDGHRLVENVIKATGYRADQEGISSKGDRRGRFEWKGMGRDGILEETCDAGGYCSQNAQTFKGIFFHHLEVFCRALPTSSEEPHRRNSVFKFADEALAEEHERRCKSYHGWIRRNARAAYGTRDENDEFGMWWGPGLWKREETEGVEAFRRPAEEGTDYRNRGVPDDLVWRLPRSRIRDQGVDWVEGWGKQSVKVVQEGDRRRRDPNRRGRGRTVETQSGGLAVLGALYGLVDLGS